MEIKIVFEDKNIIVIDKPPGMPSQRDKTGDGSVLDELEAYFKREYKTIIHRLDRPVGGLMVFPKNKEAAKNLSAEVKNRVFNKTYYALCQGYISEGKILLKDYLAKDKRKNMSFVSSAEDENAKEALLEAEVLERLKDEKLGEISLVRVNLITGRHHQIRLQLANFGHFVLGDRKYGKRVKGVDFPALFAGEISFKHPVSGKMMIFKAKPNYYPFDIFDFSGIIEKNM